MAKGVNTSTKVLFYEIRNLLTIDEELEEKDAITYWLLQHHLNLSPSDVLTDRTIDVDWIPIEQTILRINKEEPIQYIFQEAFFYGRRFNVTPSVLIPRPETELLVEEAIKYVKAANLQPTILDIGTGSGCIAVSVALELPGAKVYATDIDSAALDVALRNSKELRAKVEGTIHNILKDPIPLTNLDVVVSNPPYVMEKESLKRNVAQYEPSIALLVPNHDPLLFHRNIAAKALASLKKNGLLIMEINETLGPQTAELLISLGYKQVQVLKDLRGKDRIVKGTTD